LQEAYAKALTTDPEAAFGGIIAFNRELDAAAAQEVAKLFVEVLIAPSFSAEALQILGSKKNLRLLQIPLGRSMNAYEIKRVGGGVLLQSPDTRNLAFSELEVVTTLRPTPQQLEDMLFAWRVAKFVKSNAIVFCANGMTLGVGAGQVSRVDAARAAVMKSQQAGLSLAGSAVASDAFFPFRDGVDVVADAGATCIIQPGGSVRDQEVIDAANERGLVMMFTGVRHFRH
jgi:phosphoribosylaminoimidazolecarboxamide formyltransferase/IMP cyclohydrolase